MTFDGSHPDARYGHLSIRERYWIHDRPARHHRLLPRARRGRLPDRRRGLLRAAADRAPCRRRRHRARLRAQGDRRPRSAAPDLVARGRRGRRGLRLRPHRAARAGSAHRLPPPEDPGRRRPGPAREARGVGALLPRARGAGRRRAPAQHRRRPQLQRHHRLLMGARLGHTLSGTLSGILSGALSGIAARIAAVPGMERWIGPDDGAVVAQSLSLAALAWPGRARWHLPGPVRAAGCAALVGGGAVGIAAGRTHGARLTPRVEPPEGADLFTGRMYAWSRNPIYAGLLVAGGGWAVLRRRPEPMLAWAGLLAALTTKVRHEEVRLRERFGDDYEAYRRRTPRFFGLPRPPHGRGR